MTFSQQHWFNLVFYITMAVLSTSALPVGIMSLHTCSIHILPIWLIFHGIISMAYYGNALYHFSLIPVEVRSLKDRYMSLRDNISVNGEGIHHENRNATHDHFMEMTVRHMENDSVHKPFKLTSHEWMSFVFFLVFTTSLMCGIVMTSLHPFCQQWTYTYAVSLCIVTCVIFFFQACKTTYM